MNPNSKTSRVFLVPLVSAFLGVMGLFALGLRETSRVHKSFTSPSGRVHLKVRSENSLLHPLVPAVNIYFEFERDDGGVIGTKYVGTRDLVSDVDDAIQTIEWESAETIVVAKPGFVGEYRVTLPPRK